MGENVRADRSGAAAAETLGRSGAGTDPPCLAHAPGLPGRRREVLAAGRRDPEVGVLLMRGVEAASDGLYRGERMNAGQGFVVRPVSGARFTGAHHRMHRADGGEMKGEWVGRGIGRPRGGITPAGCAR